MCLVAQEILSSLLGSARFGTFCVLEGLELTVI
jgi:hypothetical protein